MRNMLVFQLVFLYKLLQYGQYVMDVISTSLFIIDPQAIKSLVNMRYN